MAAAIGVAVPSLPFVARPVIAREDAEGGDCLAVTHVTVLSMVPGAAPQPDMTAVIEGQRIASIEPAIEFTPSDACVLVNGSGRWLLPGLFDMHVHFLSEPIPELDLSPEEILAPYLANGVMQIVDMAATPDTNAIRDAIVAGEVLAPYIASAAMIDGSPAIRPGAREVAEPEEAKAVVEEIGAAGFDFIKVYSRLEPEVFVAVLNAAEDCGIRVIGHIPGSREVPVEDLVQPGFAMIAHAEEFAWSAPEKSDAEIAEFVDVVQESGAALTSTLYLDEQILAQTREPAIVAETEGLAYVHPVELMLWFEENAYVPQRSPERIATLEAVVAFNARLVKAMVDAGVPVFAGTDASFVPGLAPGYSLHEELDALVRAGLLPTQALQAATSIPATWLGVAADRGTVEVGKRANLMLLDASPLADIRNSRAIAAVIFDGEYFDRQALDSRLASLDARYAQYRPLTSPVAAEAIERQSSGAENAE